MQGSEFDDDRAAPVGSESADHPHRGVDGKGDVADDANSVREVPTQVSYRQEGEPACRPDREPEPSSARLPSGRAPRPRCDASESSPPLTADREREDAAPPRKVPAW